MSHCISRRIIKRGKQPLREIVCIAADVRAIQERQRLRSDRRAGPAADAHQRLGLVDERLRDVVLRKRQRGVGGVVEAAVRERLDAVGRGLAQHYQTPFGAEGAEHHHQQVLQNGVTVVEEADLAAEIVERLQMKDALFQLAVRARRVL